MNRAIVCCALVLLVGCAERELDWNYRFADSATRAQTSLLEARVTATRCEAIHGEDRDIQFLSEFPPGGTTMNSFPALTPGRWSFYVQARDEACNRIAEGCVEVQLPSDTEEAILILLQPVTPIAACDGPCGGAGSCFAAAGD